MAATTITDLIIPNELRDRTQVNLAKRIDFLLKGAAQRVAVGPGAFVNMRGFNELTGDDVKMTGGGTYTLGSITQHEDIAPVIHRIRNFGAEDLAAVIAGNDPMGAISAQLSNYFANKMTIALQHVLEGVFDSGGPLYSTNMKTVYNNTTKAYCTPANATAAMALLGDNMVDIGVIFMHSATLAYLTQQGYIESSTNLAAFGIDVAGNVRTFMGRPVIVSDQCRATVTGGGTYPDAYHTYFVAPGALEFGIQKDVNPEVGRDTQNKVDYIATDVHFAPHIRGIKWNVATTNPTNAELATGTNWALAYDREEDVKIVALIHNN